jgi:hypothetical protein
MRPAVVGLAGLAVAGALAGCNGGPRPKLTNRPVRPAEWKAVLNDWYDDGRIEGSYSCGAAVIAASHLPPDPVAYSDVQQVVDGYARKACVRPGDLEAVRVGMADSDVAAFAGAPRLPPVSCWYYPVTIKRNGLRVCFKDGRASIVQAALHL